MSNLVPTRPTEAISTNVSGATSDEGFVEGWLRTVATNPNTRRVYSRTAQSFLNYLQQQGEGLRSCALQTLLDWLDLRPELSLSTKRLRVAVIKSLFSLAHRTGYCPFNVAAVVRAPRPPQRLAERILTEEQVYRLFSTATPKQELLLRLLYYTGARISELCALQWRQVHFAPDGAATVTLHGKGDRTRYVHLKPSHARILQEAVNPEHDGYVLATRTGKPLHRSEATNMVRRAVKSAAKLDKSLSVLNVSPHWFRHSHATHALNRGAPPQLVQATLGHASLATTSVYVHANPSESSGRYLGD
jgi:site-specific recombinase XerD